MGPARSRQQASKFIPSPAMVVALIALFVAMSGTAYSAAKIHGKNIRAKTITHKQLKNSAVTSAKIRNNAVTSKKIRKGAVQQKHLAAGLGVQGPQGAQGPQGPQGAAAATRVTTVSDHRELSQLMIAGLTVHCPAGMKAVSAWGSLGLTANHPQPLALTGHQMSRPVDEASGWEIVASNPHPETRHLRVTAVCIGP